MVLTDNFIFHKVMKVAQIIEGLPSYFLIARFSIHQNLDAHNESAIAMLYYSKFVTKYKVSSVVKIQ